MIILIFYYLELISHFDSLSFPSINDKLSFMPNYEKLDKKINQLREEFEKAMESKKTSDLESILISQSDKFQNSLLS